MKRISFCMLILVCAFFVATLALASDQSDLMGRAATWENEYNANNLEAVLALYAEDACRMPPNQETAHGSEAVLAQLKSSKEQGGATVKITVTSAETMGVIGWGTGTYEIMSADGTQMDQGKWMNISKKIKGGAWKIQCDIWNSNKPLPTSDMK